MRQFYFSYKQVKYDYSLPHVNAVICGRFNITVNWDYLHAQNQGKLASVCLQWFSSIFETSISVSRMKRSSYSLVNMCFYVCIFAHESWCGKCSNRAHIVQASVFFGGLGPFCRSTFPMCGTPPSSLNHLSMRRLFFGHRCNLILSKYDVNLKWYGFFLHPMFYYCF